MGNRQEIFSHDLDLGPAMTPDFSSQTAKQMTRKSQDRWANAARDEMCGKGATFTRLSRSSRIFPALILMEGWLARPDPVPAPSFQKQKRR